MCEGEPAQCSQKQKNNNQVKMEKEVRRVSNLIPEVVHSVAHKSKTDYYAQEDHDWRGDLDGS
jgi:hypothetical protein